MSDRLVKMYDALESDRDTVLAERDALAAQLAEERGRARLVEKILRALLEELHRLDAEGRGGWTNTARDNAQIDLSAVREHHGLYRCPDADSCVSKDCWAWRKHEWETACGVTSVDRKCLKVNKPCVRVQDGEE